MAGRTCRSQASQRVENSPACPGVVKKRDQTEKLKVSFSNVTYKQVSPYVWLNPNDAGRDNGCLEVFRSRIPTGMFQDIVKDVELALKQYGQLESHDNEETRSRFLASLFNRIIAKKGRIEHHFVAVDAISIIFIEVKKILTTGKHALDTKGQVLAECAACDYANYKDGHWVPILAILCDGNNFEYFVYDSGNKRVYTSGRVTGIISDEQESTAEFLYPTKKKMGESPGQGRNAHWLLREAAKAAQEGRFKESETMASNGVEKLKLSVSELPRQLYNAGFDTVWDGTTSLEEALKDRGLLI
ncbi:hypothetical protein T310_2632 [Rasamsonia emersonii CBS 393.64]|uniref:Uncharacterized protein n=1 Tax=Rasamsonia emersonii (strain ATCC 16479 / CBS 393.64 / IMI 116815) TaxID=1408163 RepID=A0A0F4Z0I6_RASE3|nr:hypothetical protein T310_2632 [Rasamsonia emersonii CBS 393.64]KKA23378.1 hypothetical protein T310_2632 [Rasamsonia emersonii CBS 393.64]